MYLEPCTKDQLLEFYAEFDATEESVSRDVEYLIKWIEKEPHLPNVTGKVKIKIKKVKFILLLLLNTNINLSIQIQIY